MASEGPLVVVVGPPGAGKTTVARALARRLGVEHRDTDADVEAHAGRAVAKIFAEAGEAEFRRLESVALAHALAEHRGVLSLGGGAPVPAGNQELLGSYAARGGQVVFLDVSEDAVRGRVGGAGDRPLLAGDPVARFRELIAQRRPAYEAVATIHVDTSDLVPAEVVDTVVSALRKAGAL